MSYILDALKKSEKERTLVININLTRGLVAVLIAALLATLPSTWADWLLRSKVPAEFVIDMGVLSAVEGEQHVLDHLQGHGQRLGCRLPLGDADAEVEGRHDTCIALRTMVIQGRKVYGLAKSVSEYCFVRNLELLGEKEADHQFSNMDPGAAAAAGWHSPAGSAARGDRHPSLRPEPHLPALR